MATANLSPTDVTAAIVYVESADPEVPHFILLDEEGKSLEDIRAVAFEILGRDDVVAIGMVFKQYDAQASKQAIFPYQFTGLSPNGIAVLRKAATIQDEATAILKTKH
ncbi:hypothetical protein [Edaphobacter sp. HDX4]|uniref:hypothetical protein n=1 Tax=Edaphobacter sp. HDX4 TaxID=2794064 RepID=UPI002FE598C6